MNIFHTQLSLYLGKTYFLERVKTKIETFLFIYIFFLFVSVLVIDGGFSDWSDWSTCSDKCKQERSRDCTNPKPKNGGNHCLGATGEEQECTDNEKCKGTL